VTAFDVYTALKKGTQLATWHALVCLQTGTHPRDTTARNCDRFRQQLQSLGFSYDWDREISTTDPGYYKCESHPFHPHKIKYSAAAVLLHPIRTDISMRCSAATKTHTAHSL
jgi:hypothetical protein